MTPDLSIVIVNYNTCDLILACLKSVYNTNLSIECIVVDNASWDGSVQMIRASYPQVRLIVNAQNRYFSAAYTQGIEQARGRYILVLNPDMVIEGNTLTQLTDQIKNHSEIGAATTLMHFPDGQVQRNGSRFVTFNYLLLQYTFLGKLFVGQRQAAREWLWYADWDRNSSRQIDVLPGSCILASREVWIAARGFNDKMLMFFSDDYLALTVQRLGKQTWYLVSDGIVHYEGVSAHQKKATLNLYFHDLLIYIRLVFGRFRQVLFAGLLIPTWIVQYIKAQ